MVRNALIGLESLIRAVAFIASERLGIAGRYNPPLNVKFESLNGIFTWNYLFSLHYVGGVTVEMGCGTGYGVEKICEKAESGVGIDISRKALRKAIKRTKNNSNYVLADCQTPPIRRDSVDCVIAFEIIEHLEKPETFLTNIRSVLKNNSVFILSTPIKRSTSQFNPFHLREFETDEIVELFERIFHVKPQIFGKEIVDEEYLAFRKSFWGRLLSELKAKTLGSFLASILERFLFNHHFDTTSFKLSKSLHCADNQFLLCRI